MCGDPTAGGQVQQANELSETGFDFLKQMGCPPSFPILLLSLMVRSVRVVPPAYHRRELNLMDEWGDELCI